MKDRQIERAEQMALQESKEEEAALDSLLVEEEVEEMSAEDMFAMLEADNEDATTSETKEGGDDQSADDLYAMLNDWGESVGVPVHMTHVQHDVGGINTWYRVHLHL